MILWLIHRAADVCWFEVRPHTYDVYQRDWFPQGARLLACSWAGAEALVPRRLVKLAIGEDGAWFGPVSSGGAVPQERMPSMPVRTLEGSAA